MDKSFNDQELSDIMKEIEALEEDFTAEEKTASPVMEELADMEESVSVPVSTANVVSLETSRPAAKTVEPVATAPVASATPSAHTSMNFKIQGSLTMELQFDIGGKTVSLEVSETGLNIQLENGMKFTVPVAEKSALKKAV